MSRHARSPSWLESAAAELTCDPSPQSDFPCSGSIQTYWLGGPERGERICEEHRRRMLMDIQDEWAREKER